MTTTAPSTPPKRSIGEKVLFAMSVIAGIAMFAIMLHTLANVAGRFLFNAPVANTIEIVSYWYMPILAYFGFVLAKVAKQSIDAPIVFDNLTWGNRRILVIAACVIATLFCALAAYYTLTGDAIHGMQTGKTAGVSSVVIWPVLFIPPIIFAVLTAMYIWEAVQAARGNFDDAVHDVEAELEASTSELESELRPTSDLDEVTTREENAR